MPIAQSTGDMTQDEAQQLRDLCRDMLSMLTDLQNGFGWDELSRRLDDVTDDANGLGIELDD